MQRMVDRSQVSLGSALVMGCAIAFFLGMMLLSLYGWSKGYPPKSMELFTELLLTLVLVDRAIGRYVCELHDSEIRITGCTWPGFRQTYLIPYERILGLYQYAPQLVSAMSFRHTRRLQSALDSRPVWTLAYTAEGKHGQAEHCRIYLKMSTEMLASLQGRLAHAIPANEEELAALQTATEK